MTLPPRRRRPINLERQSTVNDAMVPGAFRGRVPIVAPVIPRKRMDARAKGVTAVADPTMRGSQIDQFTLASGGAQSLTLTYVPVAGSWNVSLNGVAALDTTEYTVSASTLALLSGLGALTGDVVEVQYDYLAGMPQTPTDNTSIKLQAVTTAQGQASTLTISSPVTSSTQVGMLMLVMCDNGGTGNTISLSGWTQLYTDNFAGNWTATITILARVVTSADIGATYNFVPSGGGTPRFALVNALYNATSVAVHSQNHSSVDLSAGASWTGPTLTTSQTPQTLISFFGSVTASLGATNTLTLGSGPTLRAQSDGPSHAVIFGDEVLTIASGSTTTARTCATTLSAAMHGTQMALT